MSRRRALDAIDVAAPGRAGTTGIDVAKPEHRAEGEQNAEVPCRLWCSCGARMRIDRNIFGEAAARCPRCRMAIGGY
jgi:hypothetical protein